LKTPRLVDVVPLLIVCTLPSACTTWRTTALRPERFSAQESPNEVRLTLGGDTTLNARHPVLVGDSLIWVDSSRAYAPNLVRRAVPVSSIRQVETHRFEPFGTAALLLLVGAVVGYVLFAASGGLGG